MELVSDALVVAPTAHKLMRYGTLDSFAGGMVPALARFTPSPPFLIPLFPLA